MAEINRIICAESNANVGFGDCVLNFNTVAGAFLTPPGFELTPAQLLDLQTTLQDAANAPLPVNRIYPIHSFEQLTDGTEDLSVTTLGYGGKAPGREGDYDWVFQFMRGGMCLLKALRKFNNTGKHFLFYDDNGILIGQKSGENLKAIPPVMFWANKWRPADGTNPTVYAVRFVFKPNFINDKLGFVQAEFSLEDIQGLQDIALVALSADRPVFEMKTYTGCGRTDLYELYADELAAVANWGARINGAEIEITSVATNDTLSSFTVTLDVADPNYSATAPVTIYLKGTDVLSAAGVEGFEGVPLNVPAV